MFFVRSSEVVFDVDATSGLVRIIPVDRKNIFYLNELASFLFLSLNRPKTLTSLVALVTKEFSVKPAVAQKDIEQWLKEATKFGFVQETAKNRSKFDLLSFLKKIKNRVLQ